MFTLGPRHCGSTSLTTFFFQLFFEFGARQQLIHNDQKLTGILKLLQVIWLLIRIGLHQVLLELILVQQAIIGRQKNKEIRKYLGLAMDVSAGDQTFYCFSQSLPCFPTMGMIQQHLNEHYSVLQNLQSGHSIDPSTIWPTTLPPKSWQESPSRVGIKRSGIGPATRLLFFV